jgi:hypothetical protein
MTGLFGSRRHVRRSSSLVAKHIPGARVHSGGRAVVDRKGARLTTEILRSARHRTKRARQDLPVHKIRTLGVAPFFCLTPDGAIRVV